MDKASAYKFHTAIGTMALAWEKNRIVALQLPEKTESALLASLKSKLGDPSLCWSREAPPFAREVADAITLHLAGKPQKFSLRHFEMECFAPFFRKVYENAVRIPAGTVVSYAKLAEEAGSPKASRAVGQAMARNPYPIVVPCHRVVGSGKSAGGFSAHGGLSTKARILAIEAPGKRFFDVTARHQS